MSPGSITLDANLQEKIIPQGTYTAIAYNRMRCAIVHNLYTAPISFSGSTYNEKPVPTIDFNIIYDALINIFAILKEISTKSGKLFKT